MKSPCLLVALFSLLLFADTMEGRRDPTDILVLHPSSLPVLSSEKNADCHDQNMKHGDEEGFLKEKIFVVDFEPRPSVTAYPDEIKSGEEVLAKNKKPSFPAEFEPRPDVTFYHG